MNVARSLAACCLVALSLLGAGCKSADYADIRVDSEADPKVDFGGYETYAWLAAAALVRDPESEWAPPNLDVGAEIKHLVDRELRAWGMTQVVDSPDVHVIYAVGVDMKALDVVHSNGEWRFEQTPQSGLMVLLSDPETRRVMWVGAVAAELREEPSSELAKRRLDYAITKMFKRSPF